jgi:flavin reductase (DIM6/NTAB) family NADH-FMN oxidoreductase RutF
MAGTELIRISDEYRRALRGFAATVTIVSSRTGMQNYGITVTAVTSVSMMPPSLLIAVNAKTSIHASLLESAAFCVNILGQEQQFQSQLFGSPNSLEDRFDQGDWRLSPDDVPYLADAQANIFCRKVDTHRFGTHSMFIGQVYQLAIGDDIAPLMYLNGNYMKASALQPVTGRAQ